MFQISDDLLDIESDLEKNKPNICSILDKDIVCKLLKNGCNWLYINNKYIYELMQGLQDLQDLGNPAHKSQDLEKSSAKSISEKNNISDDAIEDTIDKTITFNINVINEIIAKIENRIE